MYIINKGISLTVEQWDKLMEQKEDIEDAIDRLQGKKVKEGKEKDKSKEKREKKQPTQKSNDIIDSDEEEVLEDELENEGGG